MVIGFKQRFVKPILNKTKIHTIREDATNRWKAGNTMHMATGVRSKYYICFCIDTCKSTQRIQIMRTSDFLCDTIVIIDGRQLSMPEVNRLALNDGFENMAEFWMWFKDGFNGKIIHWTDFKY